MGGLMIEALGRTFNGPRFECLWKANVVGQFPFSKMWWAVLAKCFNRKLLTLMDLRCFPGHFPLGNLGSAGIAREVLAAWQRMASYQIVNEQVLARGSAKR